MAWTSKKLDFYRIVIQNIWQLQQGFGMKKMVLK
ncbi:hypothetical protein M094_3528, partial [Bacteroides uniformis str. 3978 T3 ii]